MGIEKQVITLEQAKKLKELGFKKENYFYWYDTDLHKDLYNKYEVDGTLPYCNNAYPAYTVAELGEFLPEGYFTWKVDGKRGNTRISIQDFYDLDGQTEAEARGNMLIYLLENKLISNE